MRAKNARSGPGWVAIDHVPSAGAALPADPSVIGWPIMTTEGQITELHLWAVREGLRRAPAAPLFEDFCRRLVAFGVPLWRAFAGMRTLHPQWAGYTYTWWRDRDVVQPERRERGKTYDQDLRDSPYWHLRDAATGPDIPLRLRRRSVTTRSAIFQSSSS